jgi:hypothetical protein
MAWLPARRGAVLVEVPLVFCPGAARLPRTGRSVLATMANSRVGRRSSWTCMTIITFTFDWRGLRSPVAHESRRKAVGHACAQGATCVDRTWTWLERLGSDFSKHGVDGSLQHVLPAGKQLKLVAKPAAATTSSAGQQRTVCSSRGCSRWARELFGRFGRGTRRQLLRGRPPGLGRRRHSGDAAA